MGLHSILQSQQHYPSEWIAMEEGIPMLSCIVKIHRIPRLLSLAAVMLLLTACASFHPDPIPSGELMTMSDAKRMDHVTIHLCSLSEETAERYFDLPLIDSGVQPIWIRIQNQSAHAWIFPDSSTDPFYFSVGEVILKSKSWRHSRSSMLAMYQFLDSHRIPYNIPPGETVEGFLFAPYQEKGIRQRSVFLFTKGKTLKADFLNPGKRMNTDFMRVDFSHLYKEEERNDLVTENELKQYLQTLPVLTTNQKGTATGDPVNLVFVGELSLIFNALIGAGWNETDAMNLSSVFHTIGAFLTGAAYRFSPISALYVFGRPQDVTFQKIRDDIHTRSHMRLWLAPSRYRGQSIWIGQISRDIGVKLTTKSPTLTTHVIAPDVDAERWYLIQNMMRQQAIGELAFLKVTPSRTMDNLGYNLCDDAFFTDGMFGVLFLSAEPRTADQVQFKKWE